MSRIGATYLLEACRDQLSIFRPYVLLYDTSAIARPWGVHLGQHPLIGSEISWSVKVDGVIQAHHHANLLLVVAVDFLPTVHVLDLFLHVFMMGFCCLVRLELIRSNRREAPPQVVCPSDGANEETVGHVR